MTRSITTLY